jgi:proton-dependent oligopeptide transporter, POT family
MTQKPYLTAPIATDKMPPGVPYIIGNEAAERFCFYGMRTILVIYMTQFLLNRQGVLDLMTAEQAKTYYHLFNMGAYFFPILGAIISDAFWGKYRTIFYLSLVYCLGNFFLASDQTRMGLLLGLLLITLGTGGIKSCVSANVGDQFGQQNKHLLEKVFGWFYFSINFGSFFSTILTPYLLDHFSRQDLYGEQAKHLGPAIAFGVPGVLMVLATFVFWLGRKKFVHIPPSGSQFLKEACSMEGLKVIAKLGILYLFIAMFWALYDQSGGAWVLQAEKMNRTVLSWEIKSSQIQAVNPLLIMIMIPMFTYVIYPGINSIIRLTPLRKVGIGLFLAVIAFAISAWAENLISNAKDISQIPSVLWQVLAYVFITMAEVMVSITCLEFSYTQAPNKMKSLIMGLYLLSISMGNAFTAGVNFFIQNPDGTIKLKGADYYWFFTILMFLTSIIFCVYAAFYREKSYIQDEAAA